MAKKEADALQKTEEPKPKRKYSRQPMTPEAKEAAAKARAAEKAKAANLVPELFVQYQGAETGMATLVEAVKADFHQTKKRTLITALTMYVKPEEHMVYYVVNGSFEGKIPY